MQQNNAMKLLDNTRHKRDDCVYTPNKNKAERNKTMLQNATKRNETMQQNALKCVKTTQQSYATIHNAMTLLTDD
eukprot:1782285-Ditylum_brightwellii.AAC.1